jgi:hypothetical protein
MTGISSRIIAASLAVLPLAASPSEAETYKQMSPCLLGVMWGCPKPIPSPKGWICHWSMDLKGKEIKSLLVDGGYAELDASTCKVSDCTAACAQTPGCVAVDIMKPWTLDGQPNSDFAGNSKCVCTLFGSVTSATYFQERRGPNPEPLSGWACMPEKKAPPPSKENPNFTGSDRPSFEQDRMRPSTADPGRQRR